MAVFLCHVIPFYFILAIRKRYLECINFSACLLFPLVCNESSMCMEEVSC